MVPRYLSAIGDLAAISRLRPRLEAFPPFLTCRIDRPGLLLLASPDAPVTSIGEDGGFILGSVLGRASMRPAPPTPEMVDSVAGSGGTALIESHWGPYLLLLKEGRDCHCALRDPSGAVPVYYFEDAGLCFYASDAETARLAGAPLGGPSERFLRHWLSFPYLRTARTGLERVRELLPGTRRRVAGGSAQVETLWTPWRFAARDAALLDPDAAALAVRRAVIGTISQYPLASPCLLQLSGGLDSSILAASLSAAGRRRTGITFATSSAEGDERRYARAVATRTGTALAERTLDEHPLCLEPVSQPGFLPGRNPLLDPLQATVAEQARALGASEIVDGAGGDNVFCAIATAAPVLDAWRWRGPAAAARTLLDIARLGDTTLWRAGRLALAKSLRPSRPIWRQDSRLLRPDAVTPEAESHPWLEPPENALTGKREHVRALVHIQHFLDRRSTPELPAVHPLLAQPIVETCLRVPTWLWVQGGRDRAVARDAFADLLPPEVLARRSKGSLQGLFVRRFGASRREIRDLLLGGDLAKRGIIDGEAVDDALAQKPVEDHDIIRLTELAALELWLQAVS